MSSHYIKKMEHSDLVQEMTHIEQLSTQERLQLARRRRVQQLKNWAQRERDWLRHRPTSSQKKTNKKHIFFSDNVVLLEAAGRSDIDEVRRLLMKGVNPDSTNEDGLTALHQCCIDDNVEMLTLLLEYGANVNAEDSERWTPLHAAATCGHLRLVKHLVANGAYLLAVNADGNMPYDICEDDATLDFIESEMAKRGVTQELIDTTRAQTERTMLNDLKKVLADGGDLEFRDQQNATPLHIAAANGYVGVVEFLLDHHVSIDVKDCDDWTPVHAAACWGHLEVLELLVQNGADLNVKNKNDETPSDICEDPEIRDRIVQLKYEQESRRREEAEAAARSISRNGRQVRRSQSNTRAQSVRRTSIRDKTLTAKKDAVEEARFRMQAQETDSTSTTTTNKYEAAVLSSDMMLQNATIKMLNDNNNTFNSSTTTSASLISQSSVLTTSEQRDAPDGTDNTELQLADRDSIISDLPTTETSCTTTDNNGKINVTVTVTINAGTLADLKKQRSQTRNSPDLGSSLSTSPVSANNFMVTSPSQPQQLAQMGGYTNGAMSAASLEAVNSVGIKKFVGNTTGEVVADVRSKRCCTIQ